MGDRIVGDPHWYWYIVFYFFLGGLAAGVAFVGALAALFGGQQMRPVARLAALIPMPLALICTVILIVDLERPERFLHMIVQSETWQPMFKYWSPMSYGSWIVMIFSGLATVNFVAALWGDRGGLLGWLPRLIDRGVVGTVFQGLILLASYGLGSYVGALLNASNQLFWSDTPLIGALFFASAIGAGLSLLVLLLLRPGTASHDVIERLEAADNWAIGIELLAIAALFISLGSLAGPLIGSIYGLVIIVGTGLIGLALPLGLHVWPRVLGGRASPIVAAVLTLAGGFALRWAIVMAAQGVFVAGR